ncbi:polypyrimidine tract-binding protein 1-like isoform X2 [Symsagittifera roscoffensis]
MKRGSDADLFTPTPAAVASAPATAAGHYASAQNVAQGSQPNAQQMMHPHLASQLAALGAAGAGGPGSLPGYGGISAANMNMFQQVSQFAGNDAKKVKLDTFTGGPGIQGGQPNQNYHGPGVQHQQQQQLGNLGGCLPPSRYVTISNLPEGTTQQEIIGLGIKDGKISAAHVEDMKRQGYLAFEEEHMAVQMVSRCRSSPPIHRGNQLSVSFGSAKDMKQVSNTNNSGHYMSSGRGGGSPDTGASMHYGGGGGPVGDERTVLRVIVEMGENTNIYSQVNLEVLHHLFSRTGQVLKIITFAKPGYPQQFQALIQYNEPRSAQTAKENYDGQNLYYGCCPLKVEYSKLTNLNVKYNNEKSRDYTRPDLPTGENTTPVMANPMDQTTLALAAQQGLLNQFGINPAALGSQYSINPAAFSQLTPQNGLPAGNSTTNLINQLRANQLPPALTLPMGMTPAGMVMGASPANSNCVLLVGNLDTVKVTCDGLFTLFGVYGDVQRVKILFNKQDSALIQMSNEEQAKLAMDNLHDVKVYGREMRVSMSKHQVVQLPKEGQQDAGLTKDYSNSPLHRFRKQGSKNFQNIFPPSATLHLSNIAPGVTEEQVLEAFNKKNIEVMSFKFFPNDHKMALVQCRSREEAIMALIETHNYQLGENHHLRVSFSKTQMGMGANSASQQHQNQHGPSIESAGGAGDAMNMQHMG